MNKGILYIIISGICFIFINFFVKLLGQGMTSDFFGEIQQYPAHELVLARSIVSFVISFSIIKYRKIPVFGVNKKWLLIRGFSGTIALTLFFYTLHNLPIAVATTVQYLAPIFTVFFSTILLKEHVKLQQWLFIFISFLGVILIVSSKYTEIPVGKSEISNFWIGIGLFASVFSGLAYTAVRKLKNTDQPISVVLYFPMIATPVMTILCLFSFTMPQGIEWLFLLLIGIFTQIAQITLTKALHLESPSIIMPFKYLGAIYAFFLGYFVFNERLTFIVNMGIVLILLGVLLNIFFKKSKA